jgi:uncharacterized paraquat-inducible protein A
MDSFDDDEIWQEEEIPPQFREDMTEESTQKKACPQCRSEIPEDAIRCLYCGCHVPVDSGLFGKLKLYPYRVITIIAAMLALLSLWRWFL